MTAPDTEVRGWREAAALARVQADTDQLARRGILDDDEPWRPTDFRKFNLREPRDPEGKWSLFGSAKSALKKGAKAAELTPAEKATRDAEELGGEAERVGLKVYTDFGSSVNLMLRKGQTSTQQFHDDRGDQATRGMDAVFAAPASRLGEDIHVARGVRSAQATWGGAFNLDGDNTGLEWDDLGYVSTTVNPEVATKFAGQGSDPMDRGSGTPVLMHIRVPAGTPAVKFSGKQYTESEIVLPRGYRYRIVKDHGRGSGGVYVIDVELVGPAP